MAVVGGPSGATTAVVQAAKLPVPSKPNTKKKAATTTAASTFAVAATDIDKPGLRATTRTANGTVAKTKEALLGEMLEQLEKAHIKHRDRAGVREKISSIEKQYREAEDFLKRDWCGYNEREGS
ncbi:hypothetical protein PHMEG_00024239 [Phytophthora megakarya]|uniref:Uncharacterized protein n=1 Tax=Phytophthora megakarya TaxID=4795 RepID=A0A225VGF3_9STRA|nr:hypothetical protein PHMEG_00024239 [Phytophthora megakarya]